MESWSFSERDEIVPGLRAVRLLGGGLRYEAYLAWNDHLRALVVVKVLRPDQVGDASALRGLRNESALLQRLAHPLLVRSFGSALEGERPHLVLEFIEGPRLSTLSRRFGLNVEQVLPLALNLASALHYLAEEGVVHLDVKPRNVVMGGSPRLIDLSVALPLDQIGELRRPVGTDAYMAPEQCDPERFSEIGPPADAGSRRSAPGRPVRGPLHRPPPNVEARGGPAERSSSMAVLRDHPYGQFNFLVDLAGVTPATLRSELASTVFHVRPPSAGSVVADRTLRRGPDVPLNRSPRL